VTDSKVTRKEALAALLSDIDPQKHAGEGWHATEEIAKPSDVLGNSRLRSEVGNEGDYYPETRRKKK
jgi:hypothetical protein